MLHLSTNHPPSFGPPPPFISPHRGWAHKIEAHARKPFVIIQVAWEDPAIKTAYRNTLMPFIGPCPNLFDFSGGPPSMRNFMAYNYLPAVDLHLHPKGSLDLLLGETVRFFKIGPDDVAREP